MAGFGPAQVAALKRRTDAARAAAARGNRRDRARGGGRRRPDFGASQAEAQAVRQGLLAARRAMEMYTRPFTDGPGASYPAAERPLRGRGMSGREGPTPSPRSGPGPGPRPGDTAEPQSGTVGGSGSSAVPAKLWSFGLGYADAAAIRAVQAQYPDVQPSRLLMPRRRLVEGMDGDEGEGTNFAPIQVPPAKGGALARGNGPAGAVRAVGMVDIGAGNDDHGSSAQITANPPSVTFRDFAVGGKYTQRLLVTNTSPFLNAFRVVDLPADVRDSFSVECAEAGRFSSGMSRAVSIEFTPVVDRDVVTEISFKTSHGVLRVPVNCSKKVAGPSFRTRTVDFTQGKGIAIGEQVERALVVENRSRAPLEFGFYESRDDNTRGPGATESSVAEAVSIAAGGVFKVGGQRALGPYESALLPVTFQPSSSGCTDAELSLCYRLVADKSPGAFRKVLGERGAVRLHGMVRKDPITIQSSVVDMHCCHFDKLYRNAVTVSNSGKHALKCQILPTEAMRSVVEFFPDIGYCQAGENFAFSFRFRPTRALVKEHGDESGSVILKGQILVPDQVAPIKFSICAQLTTGELVLTPTSIDFGSGPVGSSLIVPITIHNPGRLPCHFGFTLSSKNTRVDPGEGFGYLLPGETATRNVTHTITMAGRETFGLECNTLLQTKNKVMCTVEGWQPFLQLSSSSISLPLTALHDLSTANIIVENVSKGSCDFEFGTPDKKLISISPSTGTLAVGERARLLIRYHPKESESLSGEHHIEKGTHWMALFIRQGKIQQEFPFAVHTHLWRSPIHFSGPLIEEAKSQQKLNFGQVVLGDSAITKITCTNTSNKPLKLSSDTVSPIGPFSILNPLRVVPPGATYPVYVQFSPTEIGIFHEKCTFYTPQTRNRIYLSGQGTWPDLKLEPAHLLENLVDMGEFSLGDTKTVEFELQNNEAFEVEFKVDHHVLDEPQACGPAAFYCTPARGIIEAGKNATMKIVFTACQTAAAFGIFHSKFDILTASNKVVHSLEVVAIGKESRPSLQQGSVGRPLDVPKNLYLSPSVARNNSRSAYRVEYQMPQPGEDSKTSGTMKLVNDSDEPHNFSFLAGDDLGPERSHARAVTISPEEGTVKPKQSMDVSITVDNSKRLENKILGSLTSTFRHKIICKSDKGDRIESILSCSTKGARGAPST